MSATEQTFVPAQLSTEQIEALLHDLVAIPSFSMQESAAVRYLVHWMQTHGSPRAFVDEAGNAVGIFGSGPRTLALLGHIDTFAGFPEIRREGRLLYGRGTVDAKGPLCAFAAAAAQARIPQEWRVVVIGAVEEEYVTSKGAQFAAAQYQPELCIIGEPSSWDRLTLGYKGRLLLEWTWRGPLAHSASQQPSGPERAFDDWQRIRRWTEEYNAEHVRLFDQLNATLQEINSGHEGAYGWTRMLIGFRLPPALSPQALAAALPLPQEAETRFYGQEEPVIVERDTALSRLMRRAIRAEGGTPAFVYKTGTSDMNIVAPRWRCPILAYGPGDSTLDHTPEEHIDLDEYLRAVRVLVRALEALD